MRAFVVLGLVFSIPSQEIGHFTDVSPSQCCVEWDIKRQLSRSGNAVVRGEWSGLVVLCWCCVGGMLVNGAGTGCHACV